jgi:O-antigen ligase
VVTLLGLALALGAGLLLIKLTPLGGVLFFLLAVGGVVTVIEPLAGLVIMLFLAPLWAYLRAEVPQVPAQISQVFFALTMAAWAARGLARRDLRLGELGEHKASPLQIPLFTFLVAALLSLWDAVELPVYGVPELAKWVQIALLFLFVSATLTRRRLLWLVGGLLAIGLFQAGVGLWQFGLRGEGPEHFAILDGDYYRAYGTFEQPNPYAGFLGLMLPLAVGVVVGVLGGRLKGGQGDKETGRPGEGNGLLVSLSPCLQVLLTPGVLVSVGVALAIVAALLASWSRGAWMGFGAAAAAMAFALPRRTRWGVVVVIVLAIAGIGLYATGLMPASVEARLTGFAQYVQFEDVRGVGINDANFSVIERQAHWQAALEMWRYNFWTGVGFGCYEPAYRGFALVNWPIALGHAHNYYLNIAAEMGLVGLLAYLFLWGAVFWQTWRATRRAGGLLRGLAIGLLGTWTHLSVHHLFDNLYVNNVHLYIGVLFGLLAYIAQQTGILASKQVCKYTSRKADKLPSG